MNFDVSISRNEMAKSFFGSIYYKKQIIGSYVLGKKECEEEFYDENNQLIENVSVLAQININKDYQNKSYGTSALECICLLSKYFNKTIIL
jgi:hypothetical protein